VLVLVGVKMLIAILLGTAIVASLVRIRCGDR
jgi:hypothetical protein